MGSKSNCVTLFAIGIAAEPFSLNMTCDPTRAIEDEGANWIEALVIAVMSAAAGDEFALPGIDRICLVISSIALPASSHSLALTELSVIAAAAREITPAVTAPIAPRMTVTQISSTRVNPARRADRFVPGLRVVSGFMCSGLIGSIRGSMRLDSAAQGV
jgi:hypothetical protein